MYYDRYNMIDSSGKDILNYYLILRKRLMFYISLIKMYNFWIKHPTILEPGYPEVASDGKCQWVHSR